MVHQAKQDGTGIFYIYASVLDMISIKAASFCIQRQASIDTDSMSALGQKAGKRRLWLFI